MSMCSYMEQMHVHDCTCQCMLSECAHDREHSTTRSYDTKIHPCTSQQLRIRLAEACTALDLLV